MAKALFIIAQKGFRDEELFEPKEVLEDAGIECKVASISTNAAQGKLGAMVMPDLAVKDAKLDDYDVIIVVGGPGAPELAKHKEVLDLLKAAKQKGKNLASICIAPIVLAKAGVLTGKKATVWESPETIKMLEEGKAIFTRKDVVVEDKLVTANGPAAAREFGKKVVEMLKA
ncbi:DJ-1/PfpI family protein [Candidatus Woesearchaeota archaeon]|nr:DJ-1/PfpI family protein [Candidatus Woesearchaeota archaeon]